MATLGIPNLPQAESYIAGMVGGTLESTSSNIEFKDPRLIPGITSTNVDHNPSVAYGGKVGYFFDSLPWLGGEIEGYSSTPDIKQQGAILTAPNEASLSTTFSKTNLRMTIIGCNALIRYPHPTVQPYLGAGLGIFIADFPG
jgi:Outer membrane protein beta-barrel domain